MVYSTAGWVFANSSGASDKLWYSALSAHSRVYPSLEWCAASIEQHVKRGLKSTLKFGPVGGSQVLQVLARNFVSFVAVGLACFFLQMFYCCRYSVGLGKFH